MKGIGASPSTHSFGLVRITSENVASNIGGAHLPPMTGAGLPLSGYSAANWLLATVDPIVIRGNQNMVRITVREGKQASGRRDPQERRALRNLVNRIASISFRLLDLFRRVTVDTQMATLTG
jgi:hypothetical protein